LLLGEQLGSDLVGVVQAQQLAPFLEQSRKRDGRGRRRRATWPPLAGRQLLSDRFSELFVRTEQLQPEHRRTMQPTNGPAGERTPFTTVPAPVVDMAGAVVLDVHPLTTTTAPHSSGEQVTTTATALHSAPMGSGELVGSEDRLVLARIPLAVQKNFAEVDRECRISRTSEYLTPVDRAMSP
jgi:hypothetical protein